MPKDYVCVSGASRPPGVDVTLWTGFFESLATRLSKELNLPLVFVDPHGDAVLLKRAARATNSVYIRPETNLLAGAFILANAKLYISGRYHPSIMASLGGTPCVLFESNSHKTESLQQVLEYDHVSVNRIMNDDSCIEAVASQALDMLANHDKERARIKSTVQELARKAAGRLPLVV
jgi:polysaccharide pyruvyl transferase WcaK-like protein